MKTKAELRHQYLAQREALSTESWHVMSQSICRLFFQHVALEQVSLLHTFLPIEEKREPNTWLIIEQLRQQHTHIQVCVAKTEWKSRNLLNYVLEPHTEVKKNRWGIPEPVAAAPCPGSQFNIVLVPLLAFESSGQRLGYGGGFYDRFLAQCPPGSLHIGLSLFPPLAEPLPEQHPYDRPLTHCITPEEFYKFAPSA